MAVADSQKELRTKAGVVIEGSTYCGKKQAPPNVFSLLARQAGARLEFCIATTLPNCLRITLSPSNFVRDVASMNTPASPMQRFFGTPGSFDAKWSH